jgi:ATP adenylyltransferase
VSAPHAFNVGLNLGTVAGGSLADHLHQHVVPRWGGDANFIAVIGQTKVIPQLLSETRRLLADAWPDAAREEADARGRTGATQVTEP